MVLYSKNGQYPKPLPHRITLSNGTTRTDVSTFTAEEISDAGYVLAPDPPDLGLRQYLKWDGSNWAVETKPVTAEEIKAEAYRRIVAICPEWRQRNLTAQAALLSKKGEANWTPEERAAWDAGEALWNQIAAIRAKSDLLEAMNPIPVDYALDTYWT